MRLCVSSTCYVRRMGILTSIALRMGLASSESSEYLPPYGPISSRGVFPRCAARKEQKQQQQTTFK